LLEPLRRWADLLIDTSQYSANALQQTVSANAFAGADEGPRPHR
jgi:RNase adaptor protein for sRNA GlmZ degradation